MGVLSCMLIAGFLLRRLLCNEGIEDSLNLSKPLWYFILPGASVPLLSLHVWAPQLVMDFIFTISLGSLNYNTFLSWKELVAEEKIKPVSPN